MGIFEACCRNELKQRSTAQYRVHTNFNETFDITIVSHTVVVLFS
jgi:hypothetical protein